MDILGIGPLELILILIIMLIALGPKDMAKMGRLAGETIRKVINHPTWRLISNTSRSIRNLPTTLAEEAGVEELKRELMEGTKSINEVTRELNKMSRGNPPPPSSKGDGLADGMDISAWITAPETLESDPEPSNSSPAEETSETQSQE